jgi:ABC-type transporter Mla MlaB component
MAFFNISWFADRLAKLEHTVPGLRAVILNAAGINTIDTSALHLLMEMLQDRKQRGSCLSLSPKR